MADTSEKPQAVNKAVVAPKQRYFSPQLGESVEADNLEDAQAIIEKETKAREKQKAEENKG